MKLHPKQKMLIQIYRRAAGLRDYEYRHLLIENTGCRSSTDGTWTQEAFDSAMAALETILFERVAQARVAPPLPQNRFIRSEFYWRQKNPGKGLINSRSLHQITQLWALLCDYLPEPCKTNTYFLGILKRATGRSNLGVGCLTARDAGRLIEALKDRLSYAVRATPFPSIQEPDHVSATHSPA